ncbi:MAG: hypothetical protein Q9182_004442 [Xanthomendoza sp. 2 TL-2023]
MSLYYNAAKFLAPAQKQTGSLKSQIFGAKDLDSSPKQVYALVAEASKWSSILAEVIEKAQLLQQERKLSPALALLLVHDLLLSKSGIATPATHPLRLAVTRHKARLSAELAKIRIRRGFGSIEEFRAHLTAHGEDQREKKVSTVISSPQEAKKWPHPRWVRINTLKTTLENQLETTFAKYRQVTSVEKIISASSAEKILHVDKHVPNLIALPPGTNLSKTEAYRRGLVIFQDKASCFPAYLLSPKVDDGTSLDACAAPGNKTTHLAAILHSQAQNSYKARIWACERDKARAETLRTMVRLTGCLDTVTVKAGQDFLLLDPAQSPWKEVGSLLLDPSCSGSGIVGRDETLAVTLPSREAKIHRPAKSRKRKRDSKTVTEPIPIDEQGEDPGPDHLCNRGVQLSKRLEALSAFQLRLLLHAFRFPNARKICYSTCSVHAEENEHVIIAALKSTEAQHHGWRLLQRSEQVAGLKSWSIRGDIQSCHGKVNEGSTAGTETGMEIAEACIRCQAGTKEGTQGFFVAAFTRDPTRASSQDTNGARPPHHPNQLSEHVSSEEESVDSGDSEEWGGLSEIE